MGTVSVPIQVIKTQKNNNNKNNAISTTIPTTSTINTTIDNQKGYRYVQKQPQKIKPLRILTAGNKLQTLPLPSVS
jgi:hypothetical protein